MPHPRLQTVQLVNRTYHLEVADTPQKRTKGLSYRVSVAQDGGMLFTYANAQPRRCFWMQDMGVNLDMIWLDSDKKVVHIEHDVSPKSFPKQYCPDQSAQYVVELYTGQAYESDTKLGTQAHF